MSDNNGWADQPGVPLNPEEERHHSILTPDGEIAVYLWRPAGECERGRWPSAWIHDDDDWDPREGTYLGPVLTPAEVDARIAAAHKEWLAELNHDTDALMEAARDSALEEAARVAEGKVYKERYRTWPWWLNRDGSEGNRSNDSDIVEHADKIAAAIRALSDTPTNMVLVPREPTDAMIQAVGRPLQGHTMLPLVAARIAWDAMVKAAEKGETHD